MDALTVAQLLFFAGRVAGKHLEQRLLAERQRDEDDLCLAQSWRCPDCDQIFGDDTLVVFYANRGKPGQLIFEGVPFVQWAVIVCPHCNLLRRYDPTGKPWPIPGEPFDEHLLDDMGDVS